MASKNLEFKIIVAACIILSLLFWGTTILRRPHSSNKIEKSDSEVVKVKAGLENADIPDSGNEEKYPLFKETDSEEEKIDKLIEFLGNPDINISQAAADELAKVGEPAVKKLLSKLRESTEVGIRGEIIFLLGRIGSKEAAPELIGILRDDNAYIRRNAAEALGKIKDEGATADLASSLFDEDISVRERAAWSLGEINSSGSSTNIITQMEQEKEERVKVAMVDALGKMKDQSATLTLLNELKAQNDQLYKNKVVSSLGELRNPEALQDLNDYLNKLRGLKPTDPMIKFQWQEAVRIAEEAINKIQTIQ